MQGIVFQLLSGGDNNFSHISDYSPFFEIDRNWEAGCVKETFTANHQRLKHRVFNTHLRWEIMPKGAACKYIYVYRNGKDACTSFFHHLSNQADSGPFEGTFDDFFDDWINDRIIFGSWSRHLKSWMTAAADSANNILLVKYEDLKADLVQQLIRISNFLNLTHDEAILREKFLPLVTFEHMKRNIHQYEPISVQWKPGYSFIRKGSVGDHKEMFDERKEKMYQDMLQREFPGGLPEWFTIDLL
jgi:hypothetical protein